MSSKTRRDVFQALADPTRREIIDLVAKKDLNVNEISDQFKMSRPAISQHIKILQECGMIAINKIGRSNYCRIQPLQLKQVSDWAARYESLWEQRIDRFENYLETIKPKEK